MGISKSKVKKTRSIQAKIFKESHKSRGDAELYKKGKISYAEYKKRVKNSRKKIDKLSGY